MDLGRAEGYSRPRCNLGPYPPCNSLPIRHAITIATTTTYSRYCFLVPHQTPLVHAVIAGHADAVRWLLAQVRVYGGAFAWGNRSKRHTP